MNLPWFEPLTVSAIVTGAFVMVVAICETRQVLAALEGNAFRRRWRVLMVSMIVFACCYLAALGVVLGGYQQLFSVLAGGVFLLGAGFVVLVVRTSRRTIDELRRTTTSLESVLASMDDGLFVVDDTGAITKSNRALRRLCGRTESDLHGAHVGTLFAGGSLFEEGERVESPGPPADFAHKSAELTGSSDERVPVSVSGSTIDTEADTPETAVWTVRNVAAQQRREQQLTVQNRLLRHNVRNEMNVIAGYANMIEAEATDAESRSFADVIHKTADRMVARSEKLRRAASAINTEHAGESTRIDLAAVLHQRIEKARETYPEAAFEIDGPAECRIRADSSLVIAIDELLANAVEHGCEKAPIVKASVSEDTASADRIRLRIADNGPGIPLHEREPIRNGTEDSLSHGSGIGLWTVKWIVESFGGRLDFLDDPVSAVVVELSRAV